ncbi:MAG: class I SAM-dependent methyltransferase [Microthrixaceae bacterium]
MSNSALFGTRQEALAVPTGTLDLAACPDCGFVQNRAFDPGLVSYDSANEDSQAHSQRFIDYARSMSRDLISDHGLVGARALEVGCGKGDFLRIFCQESGGSGVGMDPAVGPGALESPGERLELRAERFTGTTRTGADVILCRHTLEHVADVRAFVGEIAAAAVAESAVVFLEVPDVARVLAEGAFWDVYYEHCSYFTAESLEGLVAASGMKVVKCTNVYEDQYLALEAVAPSQAGEEQARRQRFHTEQGECVVSSARSFSAEVADLRAHWRRYIMSYKENGDVVVLWGGGSKAVSFLSETGLGETVDAVVDVNPRKAGLYLPGSALPVVKPDVLTGLDPAAVVVMNPVYEDEIRADIQAMGLNSEVISI